MRIKLFVALVGLFLIVGCSNITSNVRVVSNANKFCDNDIGYCLEAAETFWGKGAWQKSVGMSGQIVDHFTSNDVSVGSPEFTLIEVYHSSPSCSPEFIGDPPVTALGVMKPNVEKDEDGNIRVWGKVDFWDAYGHGYDLEPQPLCSPGSGAGHAFCSQKDDKAVTICINQQTDDKELAEEIFKSFRWTE